MKEEDILRRSQVIGQGYEKVSDFHGTSALFTYATMSQRGDVV